MGGGNLLTLPSITHLLKGTILVFKNILFASFQRLGLVDAIHVLTCRVKIRAINTHEEVIINSIKSCTNGQHEAAHKTPRVMKVSMKTYLDIKSQQLLNLKSG